MASYLQFFATALRFLARFFLTLSFLVGFSGYAAAVILVWDANSEPDLAGYHLYMRQTGQGYNYSSPAYTGSDPSCTIDNVDDSVEHCFVVRAYDIDGNESPDSNEACKAAVAVAPADVDDDDDGYTENQGDCDDTNAAVNPGAEEVCGDSIDQNCDGVIPLCPADVDDDGDGYTENQGDFDDNNAAVHPGAEEVCGDGVDQDCDGRDMVCQTPEADAGPDQRTAVGGEVLLNGSNSTSASGGALSYSWRQTAGDQVQLTDAQSASPTFQAPGIEQALEFELTVTDESDENSLTSTDACIVNVCGQNEPPTADAGPTIEASSGQFVVLDGSGSRGDGESLTYNWRQTEGPEVMLTDASADKPAFTSPTVGPEGASLTFQLTVTGQGGLKDTDNCIVNVTSQNRPPEAFTNDYVEAAPLTVVTLDGTLSTDPDDGIDTYRWHQLEGTPVTFDDPRSPVVNFSAPSAGPYGSNLLFALSVKDKSGLKKSAKSAVFLPAENTDPTSEITETATELFVVEPITMTLFQKGPFYQAKASVYVVDVAGAPVKDVAVVGTWSLPDVDPYRVTAYTSGAGEAKIDSERFKGTGASFTVESISKDLYSQPVGIQSELTVP